MVTKSKERNFLTNDWTCTPKVLIMWPIVQFWFSSGSTSKSFAEDRSAHIDATVSLLQKKCIFATETQQFAAKVQSVCKNKKWCAKISRAFVERQSVRKVLNLTSSLASNLEKNRAAFKLKKNSAYLVWCCYGFALWCRAWVANVPDGRRCFSAQSPWWEGALTEAPL